MANICKTEGIILGHYDSGEADKLLNVFTKDFGKLKILAKGIRLPKSKLKGHLNSCSHARLMFVVGRDMPKLTDAEEYSDFLMMARSENLLAIQTAVGFVNRMIQGSERDDVVWRLLLSFLEFSGKKRTLSRSVPEEKVFRARMLYRLGYISEIHSSTLKDIIVSDKWDNLPLDAECLREMERLFDDGIYSSHL